MSLRRYASLDELRAARPHVQSLKVQWGDMDALGHVNNVTYFQYLENARIALLEDIGASPRLFNEGFGIVVADAACRYKAPVLYPDTLYIGIGAELVGEDRMRLHYDLFSTALQRVVAEAETLMVTVDAQTGRKMPMPDWFRAALQTLAA